jgi:hypothetical protein
VVVLGRKGQTRADGHLRADNPRAAVKVRVLVVEVHRPALTTHGARGAPEQLGEDLLHRLAAHERLAVAAVARDEPIVVRERTVHADRDRLLPV